MTRHFHVNRQPELALLEQLLHPHAAERIFLLQAPPGFGKSLLLDEFEDRLQQKGHTYARIDLDGGGLGPFELLLHLCEEWGRDRFPLFRQELERAASTVNIRGVQIGIGQKQQSFLGGSPEERKERIAILTARWIEDCQTWLENTRQALIIVDTYNLEGSGERRATVDAELQTWLDHSFLVSVRRTPGLRLILAGQQTPGHNRAWERCCLRHTLGPISNPEDWMHWVEKQGHSASREAVEYACLYAKGEPLKVVMHLGIWLQSRGVA